MHQNRQLEPELMDDAQEAKAYAAADFGTVNQAFVDRLLELTTENTGPVTVVDLGTGPGDIPLRLAAARPPWQIVAVDASAAMLELARKAIAVSRTGNIKLHQADVKATGLTTTSFDIVCSNSLLHHLPDGLPLWAEIKRLAKPGGLVFLRDLARPATPRQARMIVDQYAGSESQLLQDEFYRSLLAALTPEEIRAQLLQSRLEALQVAMASDRHLDVIGRL